MQTLWLARDPPALTRNGRSQRGSNVIRLCPRADCEGEAFATGYRTWFHVSVAVRLPVAVAGARGTGAGAAARSIRFEVAPYNRQSGLLRAGHRPSIIGGLGTPKASRTWRRLRTPAALASEDDGDGGKRWALSFSVTWPSAAASDGAEAETDSAGTVTARWCEFAVAFCFPSGYLDALRMGDALEHSLGNDSLAAGSERRWRTLREAVDAGDPMLPAALAADPWGAAFPLRPGPGASPEGDAAFDFDAEDETAGAAGGRAGVYFARELLVLSRGGRRVELWTVTAPPEDGLGEGAPREGRPFGQGLPLLPAEGGEGGERRPLLFPGRPVVYVSARVHPGETPATHSFAGLARLLTRPAGEDPRADALRRRFVFKLVPVLNPDGVALGHYRADTLGENLNRVYGPPQSAGAPPAAADGAAAAAAHSLPPLEASPADHPSIWASQLACLWSARGGTAVAEPAPAGPTSAAGDDALFLYLDMHAHVAKRGCFFYGNHLPGAAAQVENLLFPNCAAMHCAHVDMGHSVFSAQNMTSSDKRDAGRSKEGSGRVGTFALTGCSRCYTLECNYCTGRGTGKVPHAKGDGGRATPPPTPRQPAPKYTPEHWQHVGRACALALLEMTGTNPWPRLPASEWRTLTGLRVGVARRLASDDAYKSDALRLASAMQRPASSRPSSARPAAGGPPAAAKPAATPRAALRLRQRRTLGDLPPAGTGAGAASRHGPVSASGRRRVSGSEGRATSSTPRSSTASSGGSVAAIRSLTSAASSGRIEALARPRARRLPRKASMPAPAVRLDTGRPAAGRPPVMGSRRSVRAGGQPSRIPRLVPGPAASRISLLGVAVGQGLLAAEGEPAAKA